MSERLDAYLAHRGYGTRSEARNLVRSGRVRLGGRACRDPGRHVDGTVQVNGQLLEDGPDSASLLVHKPLGLACSHDPAEAPLLEELYPENLRHLGIEPAGRLDRATTGLLICTTDGALIHRLTNPRRHIVKRYQIRYIGTLSARAIERVANGLALVDDDRPALPAVLELPSAGLATLHLREGRHHQVRRMIQELGGEVAELHRDRIGCLDLPADLPAGAVRDLTEADRKKLTEEPADMADAWAALDHDRGQLTE